jgi:leukotriene-A4 hydrolase
MISRAGRMKFCRPIFRMASQVDKALAQEVFKGSKDAFHPIARRMIEKVSVIEHFYTRY